MLRSCLANTRVSHTKNCLKKTKKRACGLLPRVQQAGSQISRKGVEKMARQQRSKSNQHMCGEVHAAHHSLQKCIVHVTRSTDTQKDTERNLHHKHLQSLEVASSSFSVGSSSLTFGGGRGESHDPRRSSFRQSRRWLLVFHAGQNEKQHNEFLKTSSSVM